MPDPLAAAPQHALKYTGDPAHGEVLGGIPASDLTAEQVATWLTQAQYDEAVASGWYKEANKTESKAIADAVDAYRTRNHRAAIAAAQAPPADAPASAPASASVPAKEGDS